MASTFPAAATTPFPSATFALSCTTCVVETQYWRLGKSRPAPKPLVAAQRQGEIRFPSSVTSTVVHGAEEEFHIDRCSPSRDHRSARWSDISMYPCFSYMVRAPRRGHCCSSWAGPGTTWNSHAAPNTGTVRTLANLFPFVREFIELILLQPRQAQRSIALGNRELRCTVACSAPTGGSLLQRVISPSQERHWQAQVRVHGCEVNPSLTRSWSPSTKLLVGSDFKRDCVSPRNSRKFFGRELKVPGLPSSFLQTCPRLVQGVPYAHF